jgi:hypothetical protein
MAKRTPVIAKTNGNGRRMFTMRTSDKWIKKLRQKAKKKSRIRGHEVTVTDLVKEAVKSKYGIKDV